MCRKNKDQGVLRVSILLLNALRSLGALRETSYQTIMNTLFLGIAVKTLILFSVILCELCVTILLIFRIPPVLKFHGFVHVHIIFH